MDSTEEKRQRSLANLKPPFSKENQPNPRPSRKRIPNRATVYKYFMKKLEQQKQRLEKEKHERRLETQRERRRLKKQKQGEAALSTALSRDSGI